MRGLARAADSNGRR